MIRFLRVRGLRHDPSDARAAGARGAALIEFAVVLPFLLLLLMATIDFGHLIQTRLIITNVSREGGSIASRAFSLDAAITDMIVASGAPLNLAGPDGKVFVTRIKAGANAGSPNPTIETQINAGQLVFGSKMSAGKATLGLTQRLYDHLVFVGANGTANIPEATVVEVIYKYRPITPLPGFIQGMLNSDGGGFIIWSKAVF